MTPNKLHHSISGGESVEGFRARCCNAFPTAMDEDSKISRAVLVVQGGCIMAILEAYALPKRKFDKYHIGNRGLVCCLVGGDALTLTGGSLCF